MKVFSVYDKKAQSYNTPFFCPNDDLAKRSFVDLCRDERTVIARNPEDFDLFCLGSFVEETAIFVTLPPVQLMSGVEARVSALKAEKMASELLQVADDPAS